MQELLPRAPAKPIGQSSGWEQRFNGLFFEPDQIQYSIGVIGDGFRWRSTHPTPGSFFISVQILSLPNPILPDGDKGLTSGWVSRASDAFISRLSSLGAGICPWMNGIYFLGRH
jgi:hypothetical protein